jgi:hypothetical protein
MYPHRIRAGSDDRFDSSQDTALRQLIAECREQAASMSPEGRHTLQTIIASYDRLIAMAQAKAGNPR